MQIAEIILRYLEVFLGWPVIILIIAVIFIKFFKEPISDFFRRLIRGEAYGMRFEASTPLEQQKKVKEPLITKSESEIETYIRDNPNLVAKEYGRLLNGYIFERAFNIIYGTQINLLKHLSKKGDTGDKYINLVVFYNEFIKRLGRSSYQVADYLGFLKEFKFIEFEGEGSKLSVKITPYGIDFLSYIKTHYPSMCKYKSF